MIACCGKTGRFFGELKAKSGRFPSMEAFVRWRDCAKPHSSLDWDSLETPARAFWRKMPEPDAGAVEDAETGAAVPRGAAQRGGAVRWQTAGNRGLETISG